MVLPIPHTFSLEKSLREAPPKAPDGLTFVKRVIAKIDDDIIMNDDNQARHKNCNKDHICDINDSFDNFGWIYSQQPPWGVWDKHSKKLVLKDGFHRTHAAKKSNWDSIPFDIFSSESELDTMIYQLQSNQNRLPKKGSDEGDIVNAALQAIRDKLLTSDDASVEDFVDKSAAHLSAYKRKDIFVKIKNSSPDCKYRTYLSKGVGPNNLDAACKYEFVIPYGGDSNYNDTGAFGYVTTEKTGRMTMMNAIKLISEYYRDNKNGVFNGKIPPVLIFAYIEAPGHKKSLREQRADWLNSFNNTLELLKLFFEYQTGDMPEKAFPIKFGGFLPQLIDKDPSKGGNPKETMIVDINGKPFDWKELLK